MHLISLDDHTKAFVVPVKGVLVEKPDLFMVSLRKKTSNVFLQAVNAKFVVDIYHLWAIIRQAWVSDKKGISIVKFDLDILLRLACTRHVDNALNTVGLKNGLQDIIFIVIGKEKHFQNVHQILVNLGDLSEHLLQKSSEREKFLMQYHSINNLVLKSVLLETNKLSHILAEKAAIVLF